MMKHCCMYLLAFAACATSAAPTSAPVAPAPPAEDPRRAACREAVENEHRILEQPPTDGTEIGECLQEPWPEPYVQCARDARDRNALEACRAHLGQPAQSPAGDRRAFCEATVEHAMEIAVQTGQIAMTEEERAESEREDVQHCINRDGGDAFWDCLAKVKDAESIDECSPDE
jgi:hypothetical protein